MTEVLREPTIAELAFVRPDTGVVGELVARTITVEGVPRIDFNDLARQVDEARGMPERYEPTPIAFPCGLVVNPLRWEVLINRKVLNPEVSPNEFRLLALLSTQYQRIHPRDEILATLWKGQDVDPHVVDTHFSTLKGKLAARTGKKGAEGPNAGLLVSLPGRGFMIGQRAFEKELLTHPSEVSPQSSC